MRQPHRAWPIRANSLSRVVRSYLYHTLLEASAVPSTHPPDRPYFIQAPAKINLSLDVLGKRPDGYHDLASIFVSIALWDTLALWPAPTGSVSIFCDQAALGTDDNLVIRAARLLMRATGVEIGVRVELRKMIPTQGGLGGGSSDAATMLLALNTWWGLGLSTTRLAELGAELGSDVPFFIFGGTALVEGRGERVQQLPDLAPLWLLIVKPPVAIPTPRIFRELTAAGYTTGAATRALVAHIQAGTLPPLTDTTLVNALEPIALSAYPDVAAAQACLRDAGATCVRMSGSGPTLYVPCTTLIQAEDLQRAAINKGLQTWVTYPLPARSTGS